MRMCRPLTVIMGALIVVMVVVMIVMSMLMRVIMTVGMTLFTRFGISATANSAHYSTSNSLIRIWSPATTWSW